MTSAELTDLGGGVHRVTLPLPWALNHVHCYAVAEAGGWTIIDAGLGTPGTTRRWADALERLGVPRVRRIVISHYHPDHLGASRALQELTGADEVVQGRKDRELALGAWGPDRDEHGFERWLVRHGMPDELARASRAAEADTPVFPAEPTRLVDEGDVVRVQGEDFEVLQLPGHADGHIALWGAASGRLFGGDVLLHEITPNTGRWEDTAYDPLGRYLQTLARIEALEPRVVYPGHRRVIEAPAARAREIIEHHGERLDRHVEVLAAGATTPYEVGLGIWGGSLGFHEQRFALVEAVAHLERLEVEGRAVCEEGRWRLARRPADDPLV